MATQEAEEKRNSKLLFIYALKLVIIAAISFAIFLTLEKDVKLQQEYAYIINISGRQRMLSQYIAIAMKEYREAPSESNAKLLEKAIIDMRSTQQFLLSHSELSPVLKSMYFEPKLIAEKVDTYLSVAEKLLKTKNFSEDSLVILKQRHILLHGLDDIVLQYQEEAQEKARKQQKLQLWFLLLIFFLLLLEALFIIFPMFKRLNLYSQLATKDPLTNLYNRRVFFELLKNEHSRCLRYKQCYSVLIVDIDHFKRVNDTYGHPAGDAVIVKVTQKLQEVIRMNDQCGRIGGEEFAVLLVDADAEEAAKAAEKIRLAIENVDIKRAGKIIKVTVSVGVATFVAPADNTAKATIKAETILEYADSALYAAKSAGRNQVNSFCN